MIKLTLQEVVDALQGQTLVEPPAATVCGVATDSRAIKSGDLFFALRGDRFDGHDFVVDALAAGAIAGVVTVARLAEVREKVRERVGTDVPPLVIGVEDPLAALGRLARFHREQLSAAVVAVGGSNGKTTTKAMIARILSGRMTGRSSPKSFNNEIGVPLTMLLAGTSDDYLVVEIGTNAPGEVAALASLARPDLAVITSLAEEHLEGLGDLEGVAAEECSLLSSVDGGFAAVNIDQPLIRRHLPDEGVTIVTFGTSDEADLRLSAAEYRHPWLHFEVNGRFKYRLSMPGVHNAVNALAAIAIARRLGFEHDEIAERLSGLEPPPMRCEVVVGDKLTVLNDAYNANPQSVIAALDMLLKQPCEGRRIAIIGEMRELGAQSDRLHRDIAERLRESTLDEIGLVGPAVDLMADVLRDDRPFGPNIERYATVGDVAERLPGRLRAGDVVLLKGSRAVGLERLVDPVLGRGQSTSTG